MYRLADCHGDKLDGTFYEPELQKVVVPKGKTYRVESILRWRNKRREVLVKWSGYPTSFNSWIDAKTLVNARRIQYKILLLTYKITHRHSPVYLRDLLSAYEPTRCLRSSTSNDLVVTRTRGKAGDAAFAVAAPRLWNALPHALKSVASINILKTNLKTHLFIC